MARSTRSSKRVPLKYPNEECIVQSKPSKTRNKNNTNADATLQGVSNEARTAHAKGNLHANGITSSIFGSPVLRDRTNLAEQPLKVDILIKKGTVDDWNSGKTTETKPTKESVNTENYTTKMRSTRVAQNNLGKEVASGKSTLVKKSKDRVGNESRRSSRQSTELKDNSGSVNIKKKFFKNKRTCTTNDENIYPKEKAMDGKRRKIVPHNKSRISHSFRLRQTKLEESFLKGSAKRNLRPRKALKNYCEDTTAVELRDKSTDGIKQPIYKPAKVLDKCDNNPSEIYKFEYDSDNSREKMTKKVRKRRGQSKSKTGNSGAKKLTSYKKRATARSVVTKRPVKKADSDEVQDKNKLKHHVPFDVENDVDSSLVAIIDQERTVSAAREVAKPIVVESVDVKGDIRIKPAAEPPPIESAHADGREFRQTSAFIVQPSVQYRTMMNHILLNKSLSPISKAIDNFDPGSPWRAPTFASQQFFRVKSVVQSTPQVGTLPTIGTKINETSAKNYENVNVSQQVVDKATPKKAATFGKSPRKFGTEISNVNVKSVGAKVINENSDESGLNRASTSLTVAITDRQEDGTHAFDDTADDKENSAPIYPSPKTEKPLNSPRRLLSNSSPLRKLNKLSTKTNFIPQAGPSDLQKRKTLSESRILKQSNLNNFLNLDKMPTSTRITTNHGIFDDVHIAPISGKPINSKITKEANVENAFGFDDDSGDGSHIGLSPISTGHTRKRLVTKVDNKSEGTSSGTVTARLSIGEMKKHLRLPTVGKIKVSSDPKERVEERENVDRPTCGKVVTFSDTFDRSTETNELNNKENLLFADLEPVHFMEPPRHLYKRKRTATCCTYSDDEEENRNAAAHVDHGTKRRKISKLEKQRQKKLEEWAKDLNETFEEIDHFDLIVERYENDLVQCADQRGRSENPLFLCLFPRRACERRHQPVYTCVLALRLRWALLPPERKVFRDIWSPSNHAHAGNTDRLQDPKRHNPPRIFLDSISSKFFSAFEIHPRAYVSESRRLFHGIIKTRFVNARRRMPLDRKYVVGSGTHLRGSAPI